MWQDTVIAVAQLCFVPSMIPAVRGSDKPPLSTGLANVVIVSVIAATQATLSLWFSVATTTAIAVVWATLAVQRVRRR